MNKPDNGIPACDEAVNTFVGEHIKRLIHAGITVFGVNVSELLEQQRQKLIQLQQLVQKMGAENADLIRDIEAKSRAYHKLHDAYEALLPRAPEPVPEMKEEKERPEQPDFVVDITVSGSGPAPEGMAQELADFSTYLRAKYGA